MVSPAVTDSAPRRSGLLRSSLLYPFNDVPTINALLGRLHPLWSLDQVRARVVGVVQETADTRSFLLRPNRHWRGHVAGQHVVVEVEMAGRLQRRSYSLSSAPGQRDLRITVKRQAGSRVSAWLHDQLKLGDVLRLSLAAGEFGLPAQLPAELLMLSAGSGITPMMAMLEQLAASRYRGNISLVHGCREPSDLIFAQRLQSLASELPGLTLQLHYSRDSGRLNAAALAALQPDFVQRETLLCGPAPFMRWVRQAYAAVDAAHRLHGESFGFSGQLEELSGELGEVQCVDSGTRFVASGRSLLVEAEEAGLTPRYGCRAGICRSCLCHKREGRVQDLLTGEISDQPDEWIRLCVSAARSPLALDL